MSNEALRPVDPPELAAAGAAWSQATVAGNLVLVSGQVAWDADGNVVGRGSVEEQAEFVFDNREGPGGCRLRPRPPGAHMRVPGRLGGRGWLPADAGSPAEGIRPASTLVMVSALVDPALLVEVDAMAIV